MWAFRVIDKVVEDTLKREGKYSRTSLTMFTSWLISIVMACYDFLTKGFDYQVFLVFIAVALGTKLTDSFGKKIEQ